MGLFGNLFGRDKETDDEKDLREAVDLNRRQVTPVPAAGGDSSFEMYVEDVFSISGRGTVVTGRVNKGTLRVGDTVLVNGAVEAQVAGIEAFRKVLDVASEGDNVGIVLPTLGRKDLNRGDLITKRA